MRNLITEVTEPYAYVTKNRQRVKQYDKSVFLSNGDEFEIELFNPTTNKVLAKINLNGNSIGAGIVLRPGERVFLERHIETSRKFLFETYDVNPNDPGVASAINNNGKLDIKFYSEYISYSATTIFNYMDDYYHYINNPGTSDPISNPNIFYCSSMTNTDGAMGTLTSSASYTSKIKSSKGKNKLRKRYSSPGVPIYEADRSVKSIETGRVEKGSHSSQNLEIDDTQFNSWFSWNSEWKILPLSEKPLMSEEVNTIWCTNCGAKRKKLSHKFCPHCGTGY